MSKKVVPTISILALIFAFTVAYAGTNDAYRSSGNSDSSMRSSTDGKSVTSMSKEDLVGKEVIDSQGNRLGRISDVSMDPQTNNARFAVISSDDGLGTGSKLVPVPTDSVTFNESKNSFVLNMSKEKFGQAPMYNQNEVPNISDRAKYDETYRYFGVSPQWENDRGTMQSSPRRMEGTEGGMGTESRGPERGGQSGVR